MATIFYGRDNLQEKVPQKIISLLTRTQVLNKNDKCTGGIRKYNFMGD